MSAKTGYQIAIFDLDNTLIDSSSKLREDFVGAMQRLGVRLSPEEANRGDWYATAADYGFSKREFDASFDQRDSWEESLAKGVVKLFPDTVKSLESLREGSVNLGLLSKSIPRYTGLKLGYFGIDHYFSHIKTVHPREPSKREGAIHLVQRMSPDPKHNYSIRHYNTYFIGDKAEDVTVATPVREEYGCNSKGIYVNRAGQKLRGYRSVKDLAEVTEIILKDGS
jgi:phosphoglycolate phosphatase-like HAD superfamily hydrolase